MDVRESKAMMTKWSDESALVPIWRRYFIDIIGVECSPYDTRERDFSEKARVRMRENKRERKRARETKRE